MVSTSHRADSTASIIDDIAQDLQKLRFDAGQVSYSEIAFRIRNTRVANGATPGAAHIARSTVYDVFRSGRKRVNADLVVEIARALGADDRAAAQWRERCFQASIEPRVSATTTNASQSAHTQNLNQLLRIALLIGCVGINIFGNTVAEKFALPLFLDMTGTAVAALMFGPWRGALVALATGLTTTLSGNPQSLVFSLVGIVGALAWGYGYRRFAKGQAWWRFLVLNLGVAVLCTLIATPITVMIFHGEVGHASSGTMSELSAVGYGLWLAVFIGNLAASLVDKLVTGYLALFTTRVIHLDHS